LLYIYRMPKKSQKIQHTPNPWNNPKTAMVMLQEQYPHIDKTILHRSYSIYMAQKRMSEIERKKISKIINDMPDMPTICDFDDVQEVYKCVEVDNNAVLSDDNNNILRHEPQDEELEEGSLYSIIENCVIE